MCEIATYRSLRASAGFMQVLEFAPRRCVEHIIEQMRTERINADHYFCAN